MQELSALLRFWTPEQWKATLPLKGNKVEAISQSIGRSSHNKGLHDGVDGVGGAGPGVEVGPTSVDDEVGDRLDPDRCSGLLPLKSSPPEFARTSHSSAIGPTKPRTRSLKPHL